MRHWFPVLGVVVILAWSTHAEAAITLVQSTKKVVTAVNGTTLAYASNVSSGSLLCNAHTHFQGTSQTITTPTDTLGHTYGGMAAEQNTSDTLVHLRSFFVANASAGADTVTFDVGGTGNGDLTVVIAEFSGIATATPLDKTNVGNGTSTAPASAATATTAQADELIWGGLSYSGTDTTIDETVGGTSGFSIVQENEGGSANMPVGTEYKVVSATGTYTSAWTLGASREWICHVATFKAAAAGGGTRQSLPLLGVGFN